MWCVPKLDEEYIRRMENVLNVLAKPVSETEPVVVLDERPVQLLDSKRSGTSPAPGAHAKEDYEYARQGTANIFCITEPKTGKHFTYATPNRTGEQFAQAIRKISNAYPGVDKIHIIMDNLNTHFEKSLTKTFGEEAGRLIWDRFVPHYTPKHASWLNPAEIEGGRWSRECLGKRRIPTLEILEEETAAWNERANTFKRTITWNFSTDDARKKFKYEPIRPTLLEH